MAIINHELQDFRHLKWTKSRHSSGAAGSFLKAQDIVNGKKVYYKLSNYDAFKGIIGHECVNEIIADRILSLLEIDHLEYTLVHALVLVDNHEYETYLCASNDFKIAGESKIALDVYYQMEREKEESPYDFCVRQGWTQYLSDMLLIDYLILNRDRHGANIEVLKDGKNKNIRLAPLFDHGLSLMFSAVSENQIDKFDITHEKNVQCFVGGNDARDNLKLIEEEYRRTLPEWTREIEDTIFSELNTIVDSKLLNKMTELLRYRWRKYETFFN